MSASNLINDNTPEGFEWLEYIHLINLIIWVLIVVYEDKKKK